MWFIKTFMSIGSICGTFQLVIRIVIFALNAIQAMFHFCKCSAHLQHTTQISLGCQSCVFLWVNNCKPTTAVHLIDFQSKETTTMRNEFAGIKKKKSNYQARYCSAILYFIENKNIHKFIIFCLLFKIKFTISFQFVERLALDQF